MTMPTYIQTKPMQTGIGELLCGSEALSLMRRKLVGSIRGVAFLASAPFVALAFVIALPVIGLGALLVMVCEALGGREQAGCPHDSSAPTESSPKTEDTMLLYVRHKLDLSATGALAPLNQKSESAFAAKKLFLTAARMLGIGFIAVWTGLFALVFLAAYGGLPLVFA